MGEFTARCAGCGEAMEPYALSCPKDGGLPRADYSSVRLLPSDLPGIWRFMDWLPVQKSLPGTGEGGVTYHSRNLGRELGLRNLIISFNGYWPELGAKMPTCSFKDLEAAPTMERLLESGSSSTMVVASAGNTARAFAHVASRSGQKLVLVVPEFALHRIWLAVPPGEITLLGVRGDYLDAILVAESISSLKGFVPEGGARNIARRDGMGTVVLESVLKAGQLPDKYFQAVGSGTGGIAAWEASMRLIRDGRFGQKLPELHLAQNLPNAPIYRIWSCSETGECPLQEMYDDVLFNRRPPYEVRGGVKDALESSGGRVYGISNAKASQAKKLFESSEEIDILNAPAVAVAALIEAIESGSVSSDDLILLNITGGGVSRIEEDLCPSIIKPDAIVSSSVEAVEFLEGRP
jgi:cysteate synthase